MKFDWDPPKHERTIAERGFGFDFAAGIFAGETIEREDTRKSYGEKRMLAIGETEGFVLLVVYTMRGDTHWIISARIANRKERKTWHER